jgi:protein-disulfide isomerase
MAEMKWQAKYARQNGIHSTPTFMVDGLVSDSMSSGDSVDEWIAKLGLSPADT